MKVSVGFVGSDDRTVEILKFFLAVPAISVQIVADDNRTSPVMQLAMRNGIHATTAVLETAPAHIVDVLFHVAPISGVSSAQLASVLPQETTYFSPDTTAILFNIIALVLSSEYARLEQSFSTNTKKISQALNEFSNITKNIDILAINASIEAARAGESGRGFSVVANSIKELVKHSKQNFFDIRHALRELESTGEDLAAVSGMLQSDRKTNNSLH